MKYVFIALAFAMFMGCSKDNENTPQSETEANTSLVFTYPCPTVNSRSTVQASDLEKAIYDMDIFAFRTDGTFVAQLTSGTDYQRNDDADKGIAVIDVDFDFLAAHAGQTLVFYFVGNNASSMPVGESHTAALNVDALSAGEFENSLTLENPDDPDDSSKQEGLFGLAGFPAWKHGLLMTGKSDPVRITGKHEQNVKLVRRTARFDIYNPEPEYYAIEKIHIAAAPLCGLLFGSGTHAGTIPVRSVAALDGPYWSSNPGFNTYDEENMAKGYFYLYPCTLDKGATEIAVVIRRQSDNMRALCFVDYAFAPYTITANQRYILNFNPATLSFTFGEDGGDWGDAGNIGG